MAGGYAYVSGSSDALRIIDVHDPRHPDVVGAYRLPEPYSGASGIALDGHLAWLGMGEHGLRAIDIADPHHPREIASVLSDPKAGHYGTGQLAISGTLLVATSGEPGLVLYDIADPRRPALLGHLATELPAYDVALLGSYAYVTTGYDGPYLGDDGKFVTPASEELRAGELEVVDIGDPRSPKVVGHWEKRTQNTAITIDDGRAYLIATTDAEGDINTMLYVLDLADPTAPRLLGSYMALGYDPSGFPAYPGPEEDPPYNEVWRITDVAVEGDRAFVAVNGSPGHTIQVLDIADPSAIKLIGDAKRTWWGGDDYPNITVNGSYAYVTVSRAGLRVVDVADEQHPVEVAVVRGPKAATRLTVDADRAYVTTFAGVHCVDVSKPEQPRDLGEFVTERSFIAIAVIQGIVYAAGELVEGEAPSGNALYIIDMRDCTAPRVISRRAWPSAYVEDVLASGKYLYVLANNELIVFDASTPAQPKQVASVSSEGGSVLTLAGTRLYAGFLNGGLVVFDVADPASPRLLGRYENPEQVDFNHGTRYPYAHDVAVSGDYAYVATESGGVYILDVHDPAKPHPVGRYVPPPADKYRGPEAESVAVSGDRLLVASGFSGLRLVDVSVPSRPTEVGHIDTPGMNWDLQLAGNYAYVAAGYEGMRVATIGR